MKLMFSNRGFPLADVCSHLDHDEFRDYLTLTVELTSEWLSLYVICYDEETGMSRTETFSFDLLQFPEIENCVVKGIPNPKALHKYLYEHQQYSLDSVAAALILGRWALEVERDEIFDIPKPERDCCDCG